MAMGDYVTTQEAAELLGVTMGRVRQFVVAKRLNPEAKFGKVLAFRRDVVEEFAKHERKTGRPSERNPSASKAS